MSEIQNNPYDLIEDFISKNKPTNNIHSFAISCGDLYNGKILYNKMVNNNKQHYEIFGSNGMGYTCFALYKSLNNSIYMIVVSIQTPTHYVLIKDNSVFN